MHLTEDDLILHFYGEAPATSEVDIDAHLQSCASCRAVWQELCATMTLVDAARSPEPGADFERTMWARIERALPHGGPVVASTSRWRQLLPLAAAATIAMAVLAGAMTWWPRTQAPASPSGVTAGVVPTDAGMNEVQAARARERVMLSALGEHFDQMQLLLVELMNAPESRGEIAFERASAADLVLSSRLYRMTAEQHGEGQLADMLESLEAVLVEVARSPEQRNRQDFRTLRARITDEDLLFKVRAVSNEVEARHKTLMSAND